MKEIELRFRLNGEEQRLTVPSNVTLLHVIREHFGLMGTKEGCGEGECGACTVLMDGRPVTSCIILAEEADRHDIMTVEGLMKDGKLNRLQQAFLDEGAVQCGYCIPGMLMSAQGLLNENPHPTSQEIRKGIEGNICRCTGYNRIVNAIHKASQDEGDS
ncbi:MAG: (2Fe-2S)-binding protein [Clostridiales Family XIII bacterium]|jgi:carbon-monoxide dehydrogenase small subunit|nr:(2Fe-2S)-binding protein [Clostridiales Family XIII bacterium]